MLDWVQVMRDNELQDAVLEKLGLERCSTLRSRLRAVCQKHLQLVYDAASAPRQPAGRACSSMHLQIRQSSVRH